MTNKRYFYLRASSVGCGVIAGINGAPILVDFSGTGRKLLLPVNEFILNGENRLSVDIFKPNGAELEEGSAKFEAEVFLADPNQRVPTSMESVVNVRFPSDQIPESYPVLRNIEFKVNDFPNPIMANLEAKDATSPRDITTIKNIIESYYKAIQSADYEKIIALNQRKFEIRAAVYSARPSEFASGIADQFGLLEPETSPLQLVCDEIELRPIFSGSVFHVDGLNGLGSFRVQRVGTKQSARFNLYMGKYHGEWTILL